MKILYFGPIKKITGKKNELVNEIKDTNSLFLYLKEKYPDIKKLKFVVSINCKIIRGNKKIKKEDEVAILPPVSGGKYG
jgi:molybdopterin converting factor small subunit